MKKIKNKISIIFTLLTCICIFSIAAIADQCGYMAVPIEEKIDVEETEEVPGEEEEISEETSAEEITEEETVEEEITEQEEQNEAPTIELEIYEGPVYSQSDNVCFYRVKANVTGDPSPEVKFSKDDSNGIWGEFKTQVNLYNPVDTYNLIATATNSEGTATSAITLIWECDKKNTEIQKTHTNSESEIEYFFEIAFGAEYGASQALLHKWTNNIRIKVNGTPTSADLNTLNQVVTELNSLVNSISLHIVDQNPNIDIHFTTMDQFASIIPSYVQGNMGYFSVWWNEVGAIYYASVLLASEGLSQQERSHLIREELTQSLGIMKDSNRYNDSIFFQGWTNTANYTPIDRAIISLLYDSRLKPNMTKDQARNELGLS